MAHLLWILPWILLPWLRLFGQAGQHKQVTLLPERRNQRAGSQRSKGKGSKKGRITKRIGAQPVSFTKCSRTKQGVTSSATNVDSKGSKKESQNNTQSLFCFKSALQHVGFDMTQGLGTSISGIMTVMTPFVKTTRLIFSYKILYYALAF